jgi:hypothetical protein
MVLWCHLPSYHHRQPILLPLLYANTWKLLLLCGRYSLWLQSWQAG